MLPQSEFHEEPTFQSLPPTLTLQLPTEPANLADVVWAELPSGERIACTQGANLPQLPPSASDFFVPSFAKSLESANPARSCELYLCQDVVLDGTRYEAVLHQPLDNRLTLPFLLLSHGERLAPFTPLRATYRSDGDRLQEEFRFNKQRIASVWWSDLNLPEELADAAQALPFFENGTVNHIQYLLSRCDSPEIAERVQRQLTHVAQARRAVSQIDLVQMVESREGRLSSRYLPVEKIPQEAVAVADRVWLTSELANSPKNIEQIFYSTPVAPISRTEAMQLFAELQGMTDIPWTYNTEYCDARAHIAALRLAAMNVPVEKVWIFGDLAPRGLTGVFWKFHVAPAVAVRGENGQIKSLVLDPALADRPLSLEEWAERLTPPGVNRLNLTAFPAPADSALMQRYSLAFSAPEVYLSSQIPDGRAVTAAANANDAWDKIRRMNETLLLAEKREEK